MIAFSAVRPSAIKLKTVTRMGATVEGGLGIDVDKANGAYVVDLDYGNIPEADAYDPNVERFLIYNEADGTYRTATVSTITVNSGTVATEPEAETGTDNTKMMTPLRTTQHYDVRTASQAQAEASVSNSVHMTPLRTEQHGAARNWTIPPNFPTRAVAMAVSIPLVVLYAKVSGYDAVGDGGAATYKRVGSEPLHEGKFQSADGAWWELWGPVVAPECFGAKGDLLADFSNISTATDNTQPFRDLAAYINAVGGGVTVNFSKAIYKVWPSGSPPSTIFILSGVKGVTINGNGALLYTNVATVGLVNVQVFLIINSIGFEANDLAFQQSDTTLTPSQGAQFFFLQGGTEGVRIRDAVQNGGLQFIVCGRLGDPVTNPARVRDVEFSGRISNVYYGLTCAMSGDQVRGVLRSTNAGRSAIIYNCRQVDLTIESNHGGPFDDVEIAVYGHPNLQIYETHTSDIKLRYYNPFRQPGSAGTGSICRIAYGQMTATPAAAFIRNLDLQFQVTVAGDQQAPLVAMTKATLSGNDTTTRGHQLHNVRIGGYVSGYTTNNIMDLFTVSGSMAGESVRNIIVRDLVCEACNTDININAAGFTNLILENIVAPGCDINVSNAGAGVLKTVGFGQSANLNW